MKYKCVAVLYDLEVYSITEMFDNAKEFGNIDQFKIGQVGNSIMFQLIEYDPENEYQLVTDSEYCGIDYLIKL